MKTLLALAAALLLAACGQTGPLRLPEHKTVPVDAPAPVANDAAEQPKTPPSP